MSSARTKDLTELKKEAIAYYSLNHDVPKRIEDALNCLFYDSPHDVFGYMSDYFSKFSKPAFITRIHAKKCQIYDSKCQPIFRLDVYCQNKNREKKVLSIDSSCYSPDLINDCSKMQFIQEDDMFRQSKINDLVEFVNTELTKLIRNYSPLDQEELDENLRKLFQAKQTSTLQHFLFSNKSHESVVIKDSSKSKTPTTPTQGSKDKKVAKQTPAGGKASQSVNIQAVSQNTAAPSTNTDELTNQLQSTFYASFIESLISKAICISAACISKKELFEHILELKQNSATSLKMPVPLITMLQNGKGFLGKQYLVKEFILMPKRNANIQECVDKISKINRCLRDNLYQSKTFPGASNRCVTDNGAFTCSLDTYQQGLEMIENAINSISSENKENDIEIAINIGAVELFDAEKNKYEISQGVLKSSDELIELYVEMITKNPRIKMIMEPFHTNEPIAWYKLYSRINKQCFIANTLKANDISNEIEKSLETQNVESNKDENKDDDTNNNFDLIKQPSKMIVMPLNFFKFEGSTTVTSFNHKISEMTEKKVLNGVSAGYHEADDTFIADLSVANQVSYIKIGGFNRSERVNKLNRLIEIESYLAEKNMLSKSVEEGNHVEIEIPDEFAESVNSYIHSIDEKHGKTSKIK